MYETCRDLAPILSHELGHLYGAWHSRSDDSVMRPIPMAWQTGSLGSEIHFDPISIAVIRLTRNRDVSRRMFGVPYEVQRDVARLWKSYGDGSDNALIAGWQFAFLNAQRRSDLGLAEACWRGGEAISRRWFPEDTRANSWWRSQDPENWVRTKRGGTAPSEHDENGDR